MGEVWEAKMRSRDQRAPKDLKSPLSGRVNLERLEDRSWNVEGVLRIQDFWNGGIVGLWMAEGECSQGTYSETERK